jgi:hypothetical protein
MQEAQKEATDIAMSGGSSRRASAFDSLGCPLGAPIESAEVSDLTKDYTADGFKSLVMQKALCSEETLAALNWSDATSKEDSLQLLEKIRAAYDVEKTRVQEEEMAIAVKMAYCGSFTIYCCLCTAFTSCCIGPYFMAGQAEQLAECSDATKFKAAVNASYVKR